MPAQPEVPPVAAAAVERDERAETARKEALEENGDWVLLHRERPLEVPHAG